MAKTQTFKGKVRSATTVNVDRGTGNTIVPVGFNLIKNGFPLGTPVDVIVDGNGKFLDVKKRR